MITKRLFQLFGFACLFSGFASQAQQGCYAVDVFDVRQGTRSNGQPITDPIRIDPSKMLGQPQNNRSNGADNFFSLGKDGYAVLKMGGAIHRDGTSAPDLRVYETTWGNPSCSAYPEHATVSVSYDASHWYIVETVCQGPVLKFDLDAAVPVGVPVFYVKIENVSALGATDDFFDVDGVEALNGCDDFVPPSNNNCFATCVMENGYIQGTTKSGGAIPPDRTHVNNVIGQPQSNDTVNFLTLGYGGSISVCFDGGIVNGEGDDIFIVETSFNNVTCATYKEFADIEVSIDGNTWYPVGTGCLDFGVDISDAPVYLPFVNFVRVKNNDSLTTTPDGYDVDAIVALHGECLDALTGYLSTRTYEKAVTEFTAWPNPSRGDVNFSFNVQTSGNATLELYNINGQKVATLFKGDVAAGNSNDVRFDASAFENGVYLTKLSTEDGIKIEKIVLAK